MDIAITGMACRLPDAENPDVFWQNLVDGTSSVGLVPADRWNYDGLYDPDPASSGKTVSKWGCFLDDIWGFDPEFFGISADEAPFIDPQHRLLLELAYETIADSGLQPKDVEGRRIGVFLGLSQGDYENSVRNHLFSSEVSPETILANNLRNLAAGRIARSLNLKGPVFVIDSACSSALAAVHTARQSIERGECEAALVGGINLNITPTSSLAFSNAGALAPTANSYLFDQRNHGFTLGEGAGMILMSKSSNPEMPALAWLKGSAVNNDGHSHGPMTPSTGGQQAVIGAAYGESDVDLRDVDYIEAHGTGTPIGDLVEARSLHRVFGELDELEPRQRFVGSVKPNVGHLLSGAGMASLIKVILAFQNEKIPPNINCGQPHRRLRFDEVGLSVNDHCIDWPRGGKRPRTAGINGFGFGGTNAHVILQEGAPSSARSPLPRPVFDQRPFRLPTPSFHELTKPAERPAGLPHSNWLHTVEWQPAALPSARQGTHDSTPPVVVAAPDQTDADSLVARLTSSGADARSLAIEQVAEFEQRSHVVLLLSTTFDSFTLLWTLAKRLSNSTVVQGITIALAGRHADPHAWLVAGFGLALNDELHVPVQVVNVEGAMRSHKFNDSLFAELQWPLRRGWVAWRNGERFERNIVPIPAVPPVDDVPLTADGVYLITGGGSGVGAAIAKGLALDMSPTIVLAGRTPLTDALDRAELLGKLRWAGSKADYFAADVTDQTDVDELIDEIIDRYGRLDGIVHCAGFVTGDLLSNRTVEDREQVLAPKRDGVERLRAALVKRGLDPDFFVNFSSISAVLPHICEGLGDYAAANAYLDGIAHRYGYQSLNWTVWSESGQGAQAGIVENLSTLGVRAVTDHRGYELFKSALTLAHRQVVVVNPEAIRVPTRPAVGHKPAAEATSRTPLRSNGHVASVLTRLLAAELDIEPDDVPLDSSFANMGLDSMGAIELVEELEQSGFDRLPATLFFEYNTVSKLADYLTLGRHEAEPDQPIANAKAAEEVRHDSLPLSPVQRAFLAQQIQEPNSTAYAYLRVSVRGEFDHVRANRALQQLFRRHSLLRTRFSLGPTGAQQHIVSFDQLAPLPCVEIDQLHQSLDSYEDELVNQPVDLLDTRLPNTVRVVALQTNEPNEWHLAFLVHHIIADGWSLSNIVQEFWASYLGHSAPTSEPPDYFDAANLLSPDSPGLIDEVSKQWWQQRLESAPSISTPDAKPGSQHKVHRFKLGRAETELLKARAKATDATLFHGLLAALFETVAQWQGVTPADVVIGVAESGRNIAIPEIRRLVGPLSDIYPMHLTKDMAQQLLIEQVKSAWLGIHQQTSIASSALPPQQMSAAFSFSHFPRFVTDEQSLEVLDLLGRTGTSQTTLSLVSYTNDDELLFTWNYRDDLYSPADISQLSDMFLAAITPTTPEFLTQIASNLVNHPHNVAVQPNTTYASLAERTGQILDGFNAKNARQHDVVAFIGEPGLEAIATLLATFWIGATWLPIDPISPKARILASLDLGKAQFVFDEAGVLDAADLPNGSTLLRVPSTQPSMPLGEPVARSKHSRAFIISTSGSTGAPKGVPITYSNLDAYLKWALPALSYQSDTVMMWGTSLSFDASLRQCLAPLMSAGSMLPIKRSTLLNLPALAEELADCGVTVWSSVPALWEQMLNFVESCDEKPRLALQQVQLGGEAFKSSLIRRWRALELADTEFVNLYGPSENTINASFFAVAAKDPVPKSMVPIGGALSGVDLKVIRDNGSVCGTGERGVLLISGDLLFPGYLNDPDETSRKVQVDPADGKRYFHSGDVVEVLPSGDLVFVGRTDNQVKLRGYRIELEEIENALLAHEFVHEAAATLDTKGQCIVARLGVTEPVAPEAFREFLGRELPAYMIPTHFEFTNRLERLANGKVDRTALVEATAPAETTAPAGKTEREVDTALEAHWKSLLKCDGVDAGADFFSLGGDSLGVMELMVLLNNDGYQLDDASGLFEHRTLSSQSKWLRQQKRGSRTQRLVAEPSSSFPLSASQAGFWLARQIDQDANTTWYASFLLEGALEVKVFEDAVQVLVERHPMLRTVMLANERPPRQYTFSPSAPLRVEFEQAALSELDTIATNFRTEYGRPFDLTAWPLIRLKIVRFSANEHLWLVAGDHFVGDGLSGAMFGHELFEVYDDLVAGRPVSLVPIESNFRDFVGREADRSASIPDATRQFWTESFGRPYEPPTSWRTPAQSDKIVGSSKTFDNCKAWLSASIDFDEVQTQKIRDAAARHQLTPHDVLMATFATQLSELTGQHDLIIGTAVAGRDYPLADLMAVFGSFATILPLRLSVEALPLVVVGETMAKVRTRPILPRQLAKLAHPDLPQTVLSGRQFFFSFIDAELVSPIESEHLTIRWDAAQSEIAPPDKHTDLMLSGRTHHGRLRLTLTAGSHAIDQSGLDDFAERFEQNLWNVIDEPPNSALIGYLPSRAEVAVQLDKMGVPMSASQARELIFNNDQPFRFESVATDLGTSGTITLPYFADELAGVPASTLRDKIEQATQLAIKSGAKSISLAGVLPSLTEYGFALNHSPESADVTTGHSATVVAVTRNVENAVRRVGLDTPSLTMAFLGLGSIGAAVLNLFLSLEEHPTKLILCDVAASKERLDRLVTSLRTERGFGGEVEIAFGGDQAPAELYSADVIVAAASQPDLIDVDQLRPGAVVIDDSFPPCFNHSAAIARMISHEDVLLIGGGLLNIGRLERRLDSPPAVANYADQILAKLPATGVPSCQLEAMLRAANPDLPVTRGLVTDAIVQTYWDTTKELGFTAAPLHLGQFLIDDQLVEQVKGRIRQAGFG